MTPTPTQPPSYYDTYTHPTTLIHSLHQISGMRSSSANAHPLGHHGVAWGGGRGGGAGGGGGGTGGGGDRGMADDEQRLKTKETKPLIQEL